MYKISLDSGIQKKIRPISIMMKSGIYFLNCEDLDSKQLTLHRIELSKISHFEDIEITGIDLVRPLSNKAYPFDGPILRIYLDFKDVVTGMEVVYPEKSSVQAIES